MVDYQVEWEYSANNIIIFKTTDLDILYVNPGYKEDVRVDGTIVVTDPGNTYKKFVFSALLTGDEQDTLDAVLMGAIDHTGAYPRIKNIFWDGDSKETNVEVGRPQLQTLDRGPSGWRVRVTLGQKDR